MIGTGCVGLYFGTVDREGRMGTRPIGIENHAGTLRA